MPTDSLSNNVTKTPVIIYLYIVICKAKHKQHRINIMEFLGATIKNLALEGVLCNLSSQ